MESLIYLRWNRKIRKLHQELAFLVQGEARRVEPNVLEILKTQMEIAPRREGETAFEAGLNFVPSHFYQFRNELVIWAGVWSRDDVSNAVLDGHFSHGEGHIQRFGTIVKA